MGGEEAKLTREKKEHVLAKKEVEQKLVKKGDQRSVKKVEQRPSVEKEQNIFNKEKIGNQIEHRVKTVKERDKNDGSEAGIDSDEEVEVHRKKKKTKKQSRENSDH